MQIDPWSGKSSICTADLTNYTVEVAVDPTKIDVGHELTVQLVYSHAGNVPLRAPALS